MGKSKKVVQMEMGSGKEVRVWNSAAEAEREGGYNSRLIPRVCSGHALSANGYWWRYEGDDRWVGGEKKVAGRVAVLSLQVKVNKSEGKLEVKVVKEYDSKERAIEDGYVSVKRSISDLSKSYGLSYSNGLLFAEKEWFQTNEVMLKEKLQRSVDEEKLLWCEVDGCGLLYSAERGLASHIQLSHGMTTEEYTIRYKGFTGLCGVDGCENKTRYESFYFKRYCKEHAHLACQEGGAVGGKAEAWNRGKTKYDDERIMRQSLLVSGPGNHFFGREHTEETKKVLADSLKLTKEEVQERLNNRSGDFTFPAFNYDEGYSSRQWTKIQVKCVTCSRLSYKSLQALERGSLCKFCYPFTISKDELVVGDYVDSLLVSSGIKSKRNDRELIAPKELDVLVQERGFAVEYNGLYWHMDKGSKGFNKVSHQQKTDLCKEKGIQLFHIFSDEWRDKQQLIKSMIASRLGLSSTVIGARSCVVVKHDKPVVLKRFFEECHISGYTHSSVGFSLNDKKSGEVLSAVTLRKPINKKYCEMIEIARFATKLHTNVAGGFSKLLVAIKQWCVENGYKGILSYCDLRFGDGKVYQKAGFELVDTTGVSFWYTDGVVRYDRFKFRATETETEKKVAKKNKVYRVYGCKNAIYVMNM